MSDNLFEQLFELFNQPGPVNWRLAEEVAGSLGGDPEPIDPWLADEYAELGNLALLQTATIALLPDLAGGRIDPVDRATWVSDNLRAFDYLTEPLGARMGEQAAMLGPFAGSLVGMQVGSMVGSLGHHALGGFDVALIARSERGYLIVPNLETFITTHGLDAREARLWAALHEAVHLRLSSIDWIAGHYADLLGRYLGGIEVDMSSLTERMQSLADPTAAGEEFGEGFDLTSLLGQSTEEGARDDAKAVLAFVAGLRRHLVAGLGDRWLPTLTDIRRAVAVRAGEPDVHAGVSLALPDHDLIVTAEDFCRDVEERWGPEAFARVLESAETIPTATELADPVGWAARVLLDPID
ncbi:MAG: zinc-dependent metalloprotease [Acidimicrobiia bacterium]